MIDYLEFIARVASHVPDKGQVTVRYYGLYANAHWGKVRKAGFTAFPLRIVEEELRRVPSKGWAAMIRKVYEVDPLLCPRCDSLAAIMASMSAARCTPSPFSRSTSSSTGSSTA